MNLHVSRYNFIYPHQDNNYIAFNGRTGALALLTGENYVEYQAFLNDQKPLSEKLQEDLLYGGFLYPDGVDEIGMIRQRLLASRFNTAGLGLTIAPTLKCNFRCPYCYELGADLPGKMSPEIQDKLLEYIEKHCKTIRRLHVTWYGGEPLLATDLIKSLTARIMELVEKYNLDYEAHLITNGALLTPEIAEELKDLGISQIQITLDGPPETHDKRRIPPSGEPTFYQILNNIKQSYEHLPPIAIRVNVDKDNMGKCEDIIDILNKEGLKGKVGLYFAFVEAMNEANFGEKCLSIEAFSTYNQILRNRLMEMGYNTSLQYPRAKQNYCGADMVNGMVIDPLGYMYKCWADIGYHERAVGNILKDSTSVEKYMYAMNNQSYLLYDPTQDPRCQDCVMLPICMGGCPQRRRSNPEDFCNDVKYHLHEILDAIIKFEVYKIVNKKQEKE